MKVVSAPHFDLECSTIWNLGKDEKCPLTSWESPRTGPWILFGTVERVGVWRARCWTGRVGGGWGRREPWGWQWKDEMELVRWQAGEGDSMCKVQEPGGVDGAVLRVCVLLEENIASWEQHTTTVLNMEFLCLHAEGFFCLCYKIKVFISCFGIFSALLRYTLCHSVLLFLYSHLSSDW